MRFFLAAKRTFCVITFYVLEIKAFFFKARFVANLDDYKCVACCKRAYSCGEIKKNMYVVPFFLSDTVYGPTEVDQLKTIPSVGFNQLRSVIDSTNVCSSGDQDCGIEFTQNEYAMDDAAIEEETYY